MANPKGLTKASKCKYPIYSNLGQEMDYIFGDIFISKIKEMIEKIIPG